MSWNYRLVEQELFGETYYKLCEVYWNKKKEPFGYVPATIILDNLDEADWMVEKIKEGLAKPPVKLNQFVEDME